MKIDRTIKIAFTDDEINMVNSLYNFFYYMEEEDYKDLNSMTAGNVDALFFELEEFLRFTENHREGEV